jgi:tetratricopeptide (TPR) repeat protein
MLGFVCILVLGFYAWTARPEVPQWAVGKPDNPTACNPANAYYNLLVDGFRSGQLNLKREVPPGLRKLADPYDPVANFSYQTRDGLHDTSYYKGKLYLYFGITPALVLFWPYVALTGHYLFHKEAVAIFCAVGFLVSVALLCALRRRYFPGVGRWVVAACALALGLANCVPVMLQRPDLYEVPISCAYAMAMLALAGIWGALHEPGRRCWWLAAASFAYGLAVGARPTMLFGAVILLVPVAHAWISAPGRDGRRWLVVARMLAAAVAPISLIGFGLMLYNYQRFDNPLEFGLHYQLSGLRENEMKHLFGLEYFWFNFRVYFLQPVRWGSSFPFVGGIEVPMAPTGQVGADGPFGVLANLPLVWVALAVPLAWKKRTPDEHLVLRLFVAALAAFFAISALAVCLYTFTCMRYQVDFVPELVLLAVCGVLGLERVPNAKPRWRSAVRGGWIAALFLSVTVNLLMSVQRYATELRNDGIGQIYFGRPKEALPYFEGALRLDSKDVITHYYFAVDLAQIGRLSEAISQYEQVLQFNPRYPGAREGLFQAWRKLKQPLAGPELPPTDK